MELEHLSVAIRPRHPWEAIDLGFRMARVWWRPVYGAWFAVVLPLFCALSIAFREQPWVAGLVLWWLKPLYDRVLLHVYGRAVFGSAPTVRETLRALPGLLGTGLVAHLSYLRLDMVRAFRLPVLQLEAAKGAAHRARLKVLSRRTRQYAVWLTVVCVHLELVLYFGLVGLAGLFLPETVDFDLWSFVTAEGGPRQEFLDNLLYLVPISLIEPAFVGAGFALYLNRRTLLEGWDIELQFRRLAARLEAGRGALAAGLAALLAGGVLLAVPAAPARAAAVADVPVAAARAPASAAPRVIAEVLADDDFQTKRTRSFWRPKGAGDDAGSDDAPAQGWLVELARFLARAAEAMLWVSVLILVAAVLLWGERWFAARRKGAAEDAGPGPRTVAGLDIAPESLPPDVPAAVLAHWRAGRARAALSLLYRGTLGVLVDRGRLALRDSATEGEVLGAARGTLDAPALGFLTELTAHWQRLAYAHEPPPAGAVEALCRRWRDAVAPEP